MIGKGTILVVEDTHSHLKLLTDILVREGYEVRPADTGELALASVAAQPPELILLDIQMPGVDGFEVFRRLKAREESRDIPVIFISASTDVTQRVAGLRLGAVDYVSKPFVREELLARVATHLELFRLRTRLAGEALRSSEERFRIAAESVVDVVYEWDLKNAITWYGDVDALMGYPAGGFPRTIDAWAAAVHPDDVAPTWAAVQAQLRGEAAYDTEYRMAAMDGAWRWWSARGSVLRDERGEPARWIGAVTDITEHKRAEEAVRESEQRFREMAESLPQLVWTCRGDGTCDYLSPQWVAYTGIHAADQLGFRWLEQLHPDDHDSTVTAWNAAAAAGAIFDVEFRIRRHDGIYRWFRARGVPLLDAAGRVVKWFGTNTDIEDLKRSEDLARQALIDLTRSNKELEQFAYIASHDLQEPLRMVSSYTQLLGQRYEGQLDEKAKKYIDYAVDGAVRMQRLINDLLTYSRVGTRGKPLESTDAHAVLGEAVANLAAAIEESGAMVTNDDLPTVRTDATQLGQVFQNLLANAIKFRGAEPPRVHVSASDQGREWVFSVRDNGIGIEAQYAERVFVIFQRLHTRQEYPGTGIGLALCKRIVERHGGRIWFESEPGTGSTFFFTVPK